MYYYGGRYYDPITSTWESVDPSWARPTDISTSPYVYVQENPITYIDPDGRYKSFSDLTAKQQADVVKTAFENAKNKVAARRAASEQNVLTATETAQLIHTLTEIQGTEEDGSSMNHPGANANVKKGKNGGRKFYATISLLGINVKAWDPNKKTWLESQKEKVENIKKNYATAKKNWGNAEKLNAGTFLKRIIRDKMRPALKK